MMKPLPLPRLPAIPTRPLTPGASLELVSLLQSLKPKLRFEEVQAHIQKAYARIWLHLALERNLDPRRAATPSQQSYQALLPVFQTVVAKIGLHDRTVAGWHAPEVAILACGLWRQVKTEQGEPPSLLPGM